MKNLRKVVKPLVMGKLLQLFVYFRPYDGKWSKTMVGYGPEDDHFVIELTYNYGVGGYKIGNDFQYIEINNKDAYNRIINGLWPISSQKSNSVEVKSPDGYTFVVNNIDYHKDPVQLVALSCSNLNRSVDYWSRKCGMPIITSNNNEAKFCFSPDQCHLKLVLIKEPINHASAFGRIAFSCPRSQLPEIQNLMDKENETILTRLVSLDTPGKATVEVVILADPDGHEICFVGDEAFRTLSQVDPMADKLLTDAIETDKSDEWFLKRGGKSTQ